jgi:hypothetical protein
VPDELLRKAALHMTCKAGSHNGTAFYWTPYVAIDLDLRDHHSVESLRERYDRCVSALGATPVVLRSPSHGLHVYFPLREPVSTLGSTHTLKTDWPVLFPMALVAGGVTVRSGWAEVYPTSTRTLRMPLAWGMAQLDPLTLAPLPALRRADEVARLVASMESAGASGLDPFALADRLRSARQSRSSASSMTMSTGSTVITAKVGCRRVDAVGPVDVDRLEQDGLYAGVTRNEAALAMARRKMLGLRWSAADTVKFLMVWSATSHNGLSKTAAKLPCPRAARTLRRQYERITRDILKALATGKVVLAGGGRTGRPITHAEARWISDRATAIADGPMRYRVEVFLTCVVGFAKDRGQVAVGPARFQGADLIHVQLPSTVMQGWPWCGSGQYRRWLDWAEDSGFTRMVRNYRHSQDPTQSRARTFEMEAELDGLSGVNVDTEALFRTAAAATVAGRPAVHPRQVEHALYAATLYGNGLVDLYGPEAGKLIERLVAAYEVEVAGSKPSTRLMEAA